MVHGLVQVVASSIVTAYSIVFASRRVQRSTRCKFSREPPKSVFGVKFVTSTTSVWPSQWPRESPHHRLCAGRCGLPSTGDTRPPVSWPTIDTVPAQSELPGRTRDTALARNMIRHVVRLIVWGRRRSRRAYSATLFCTAGVTGGTLPFGGSTISDVRGPVGRLIENRAL